MGQNVTKVLQIEDDMSCNHGVYGYGKAKQ